MKKLYNILFACAAFMLVTACSSDEVTNTSDGDGGQIALTAPVVSNVTSSTAVVKATVTGGGIYRKGVCYATHQGATIDDADAKGQGSDFEISLTGLTANTTYYVRSYAMTEAQTIYSDAEISFTTNARSGLDELDDWKAPTYADDYRSISGWGYRDQWNLANVHDPTVMLADDGYYYMYQTDASYGNASMGAGKGHFHGRRSKNLIDWEYMGSTMMDVPAWVLETANEYRAELGLPAITDPQYLYWAPVARRVSSGVYRMYYAIGLDNFIKTGKSSRDANNFDGSWTERAFIGMMETSDPASNNWVDKGMVICSASDRGTNWTRASIDGDYGSAYFRYNAIDPTFIITPEGEHWLAYGSWHSGFAIVQLDPATGKTLKPLGKPWATSAAALEANGYGKRINTRVPNGNWARWQGSEGPEIVYHDGYYYLFMAYDGLDIPYNTRVVRSARVDGPYIGIDGTNVTTGGNAFPVVTHPYKFMNDYGWVGISHCAVWSDDNDNWYYCSQQRFPGDYPGNASNAVMLGGVRRIVWDDNGWPLVMPERYAAVPQADIAADEIVGTWEHIDMGYSSGNQKSAAVMTFDANGKITEGAWRGGTWSFDPETNTLTANGVKLKVSRECDWEASPRRHTLIYAGINGQKTYWGKKK
jgi:beta-xylosidase